MPAIPSEDAWNVLIIGGSGFVGIRLATLLASKGHVVTVLDLSDPIEMVPSSVKFVHGSVLDATTLLSACQGQDVVYHLASYGMSGRDQLLHDKVTEVNVQGTQNVIHACQQQDVPSMVYVSTYNVIFTTHSITNGTEDIPYPTPEQYPDSYSRSKSRAEQLVLAASGSRCRTDDHLLRTCSLRPAAIWGPGEQRHQPRIARMFQCGLVMCKFGDPKAKMDFLHVDNAVQALHLAAQALKADRDHVAAGQAYFVSDGRPINNFDFYAQMLQGSGYDMPTWSAPFVLALWFAYLSEWLFAAFGLSPILNVAEVYKAGMNHTFSMAKAQQQLQYHPEQYDMSAVVQWMHESGIWTTRSKMSQRTRQFCLWLGGACVLLCLSVLLAPYVTL